MTRIDLAQPADDLLLAAVAFAEVADAPGSSASFSAAVLRLEKSLGVISAGLYAVARDAVPAVAKRGHLDLSCQVDSAVGLSREQEIRLLTTIHDLAAALGGCARLCSGVREIAEPLIARSRIGRGELSTSTQPAHTGIASAFH